MNRLKKDRRRAGGKKWNVFAKLLLSLALAGLLAGCFVCPESRAEGVCGGIYRRVCISAEEQAVLQQPLEDLSLYAASAVLMDADSGRVLYEKSGHETMAMASTTKIMTCIVALENGALEDQVAISGYASGMPKVRLSVNKGETYFLKDLLHSLMLESHNDSAVAIAEHIGKKYLEDLKDKSPADFTVEESKRAVSAFAKLMNRKAVELGCENTWFITPNGLDATETFTLENGETLVKEHSTTAADLARIMSYCVRKSPQTEEFLKITRCSSYSFSANGRSFSCSNHNAFLNMMEGALSGKTGFTNKAGYCYVGALTRDDRTFVVALLACGWPNNRTYKWSDTRELMEYGLAHFTYHTFEEAAPDPEKIAPVTVTGGQTDSLDGITEIRLALSEETQGLTGLLLREDERIQVECDIPKVLEAPVEAGRIVGSIQYKVGDTVYRTQYLETLQTIPSIDYKWCFWQVWRRFCGRAFPREEKIAKFLPDS